MKKNYKIIGIGKIQLRAKPNARAEKKLAQKDSVIEKIWKKTLEEKKKLLFNGALLNFTRVEQKNKKMQITGHWIEYKHFIAQQKRPSLKLGVRPIGVSGMIVLKEGKKQYVLFARRSLNVSEYPGCFELVPAGGIDKECVSPSGKIDYTAKLASEFTEETGLSKKCIKKIRGFSFILDTRHHVYDIGCEILLRVNKKFVKKNFISKEYETPIFVSMDDVKYLIQMNSDCMVPTSLALLKAYRRCTD
ncbi:MAG: hypothetical protein ACOY3I_06475 [Verrucomicrobiota bacterium]